MTEATPALEARGLRRSFGPTVALDGLDLRVARGELFGLIGPDGAGKTTAIRCLAGLLPPEAGEVRVLGRDPARSREVREEMGYMPQAYSLYADLTVAENLRFFGRLFALPREELDRRGRRLLSITRLEPFTGRRAGALSGGMYKKLALACALLHRPEVLLLDEPTNGVDPISRRELWALLGEFTSQGMAVLISTPYMDEAERCDRVGLQHEGRLLAGGRPSELVAAFPHGSYRLVGGVTVQTEEELEGCRAVLACSPEGDAPRLVIHREGEGEVRRLLAELAEGQGLDLRLVPEVPTFEDLFLARLGGTS